MQPKPPKNRRGRPRKTEYSVEQQRQGLERLTTIIAKHPLERSIDNPFTFQRMSKTYGEKFTVEFLKKVKQLFKAKDSSHATALSIPSITQMLNRILADRIRQVNQHLATIGSERRIKGQSMMLCHLYLLLAFLYRHDNSDLQITNRVFWSYTELALEEIYFVAQLWSRGFGHNFIATNLGIETCRIRPLYRSLEEAYKNPSRISFPDGKQPEEADYAKLVNALYRYIRTTAQEIVLGENKMYVIKKQELDNEAFRLEQEAKKSAEERKALPQPSRIQEVEDLPIDILEEEPLPLPGIPDVVDPLAEESYAVTPSPVSMLGNTVETPRDIPRQFQDDIDALAKSEEAAVEKQKAEKQLEKEHGQEQYPTGKIMERLDVIAQEHNIPAETQPEPIHPKDDNKPFVPETDAAKKLSDLFSRG